MTERTHISSSQVPGSAACGLWETLLADALDGLLKPEDEATFTAHMAACPACTALFEEARRGREWLEFLSPEPEVPEGLLERILAQTGPGQIEGFGLNDPNSDVLPVTQGLVPTWQPGLQTPAPTQQNRPIGKMRRRDRSRPRRASLKTPRLSGFVMNKSG